MMTRQRKRQRRRRGRFGVLYKLLSVVIVCTAMIIGSVNFFQVNEIRVEGNAHYTAEEVIEASEIHAGDNLFFLNRPRSAASILRKLPYVQKAALLRHLPDVVVLRITESRAAAIVEAREGIWIVDSRGKLLEELTDENISLPRVYGLTPQSPQAGEMMTVAESEKDDLTLFGELMSALNEHQLDQELNGFIDLRDTGVIYFGYGQGLTVAIPKTEEIGQKIFAFSRVLDTFFQRGEQLLGTLYLTYGDEEARILTDRWLPTECEREPIPASEAMPSLPGGAV